MVLSLLLVAVGFPTVRHKTFEKLTHRGAGAQRTSFLRRARTAGRVSGTGNPYSASGS